MVLKKMMSTSHPESGGPHRILTWTPGELDTHLKEKMIFPGLPSEQDRQDVIAYLETLK